jgi:hypothetical protein
VQSPYHNSTGLKPTYGRPFVSPLQNYDQMKKHCLLAVNISDLLPNERQMTSPPNYQPEHQSIIQSHQGIPEQHHGSISALGGPAPHPMKRRSLPSPLTQPTGLSRGNPMWNPGGEFAPWLGATHYTPQQGPQPAQQRRIHPTHFTHCLRHNSLFSNITQLTSSSCSPYPLPINTKLH